MNFRMKNLRKIITLFLFIFIAGIFITVITINTSLNKIEVTNETVEIQKDTLSLLKTENKTV
jgi:cell division protein FtsB